MSYIVGSSGHFVPELLKCNICELEIDSSNANTHGESRTHIQRKQQLQADLKNISERKYEHDISVISSWEP